jgi:hypothetical protein
MEIWHRIGFRAGEDALRRLDEMEIEFKTSGTLIDPAPLVFFDIAESDSRWPAVLRLVEGQPTRPSDVFDTVFDHEDLLTAEWVRLIPFFQQGYPQPERTWLDDHPGYANFCPQCGTYRQIGSYRLKREPQLGKHDFFTLHWIYNLFCTPLVLAELSARRTSGFQAWDAIIHKTGKPSQVVKQLYVSNIASPGLVDADETVGKYCLSCGVTKYPPHKRGVMYMRRNSLTRDRDLVLSQEWFGSGRMAYREILASQRVARLILERGWRGVQMKVVGLV